MLITPDMVASAFAQWSGEPVAGLEVFRTPSRAIICLGRTMAIKVQSSELDREARCASVERELSLASRLPPEHRVALARLWYQNDRLFATAQDGEPVVLMHRLDQTPMRELSRERLPEVVKDFAKLLATLHAASPYQLLTPELLDAYLSREQRLTDWARNDLCAAALPRKSIKRLRNVADRLDRSRIQARSRLYARANAHLRRDGHGDLHADNLFLLNGRATLFDPLPSDLLRIDDVSADIGRLAREFERMLDPSLAQLVISAYCSAGGAADLFLVAREMLRVDLFELRAQLEQHAEGYPHPERWEHFVASLHKISLGEELLAQASGSD